MIKKVCAVLSLLLGFMGIIACDDNLTYMDVQYYQPLDLHLVIAQPENVSSLNPAIIFVHGGGWQDGSKEEMKGCVYHAVSNGYVGVSVDYRLTGSNRPDHKWPAQLKDLKCAIRWLKTNAAQYGVDPDRISVAGHSAGGQMSVMAGLNNDISLDYYTDSGDTVNCNPAGGEVTGIQCETMPDGSFADHPYPHVTSEVRAACTVAGPTDLLALFKLSKKTKYLMTPITNFFWFRDENGNQTEFPITAYAGTEKPAVSEHDMYYFPPENTWYEDSQDYFRNASPWYYVKNAATPILIIQGQGDDTMPYQVHERFIDQLEMYGRDYEYILYGTACEHSLFGYWPRVRDHIIAFMNEHVQPKNK